MAGDVYVSFGADTSELEASMAVAKAQVSELAAEMRDLTQTFVESGATVDSDLGQQMVALGGRLNEARGHVAALKGELKGVGKSEAGEEERASLFERMSEGLTGLVTPIIAVKEHFSELVEAFAAAFAVEKIADWASETAERFEQVESSAAKLGVSMEQVQNLQGIAKLSGTNFDELAQQFEKLQLSLSKVGERATPAGEALRVLGLNAAQLRAQSLDQQIATIAEAFANFADGPSKTAAAMALLGKAGADMIPLLDKGREGIEELEATVRRTGFVMSGEGVEAFAKTNEVMSEFKLATTAASNTLFAVFAPAIQLISRSLADMTEQMHKADVQKWAKESSNAVQELSESAVLTSYRFKALGEDAENFGQRWNLVTRRMTENTESWTQSLRNALGSLRDLLGISSDIYKTGQGPAPAIPYSLGGPAPVKNNAADAGSGPFGGLDTDKSELFGRTWLEQAREFGLKANHDAIEALKPLREFSEQVQRTFETGLHDRKPFQGEPEGGGVKPQVPQMNIGAGRGAKGGGGADDQALKDAMAEAQGEIDAYKRVATAREKELDEQLKTHKITMSQWLAQTVDALQDEEQDVKATYDRELQTAGLTSDQIIRIKTREAEAIGEIEQKIANANAKAAEAAQKSWDQAFGEINRAFESQIDGLLHGTTSWAQAFKNVLATLVEDLTKFFVNWGLQQAERTIQNIALNQTEVAAHQAGNAAKSASDAGAATSGGLAWAASALQSIEASAAEAFAGVFGWFAPILGPGAAGPAAGAEATVLSVGSHIATADIGMWSVPSDMLTLVHHNELIMPAAQAGAFRDLLSRGGGGGADGADSKVHVSPSAHFHITSMNSQDVERALRGNQAGVMNVINQAVRDGAHLGLRRIGR